MRNLSVNKHKKNVKLYFLQELNCGNSKQVYSGHSGTGKNFAITVSDYGKYAMRPTTKTRCKELVKEIEKDAKGRKGLGIYEFKWKIVPMVDIDLFNFHTSEDCDAYKILREEQRQLVKA